MRYTVKDLLESGQFPEMKLISGESELNREIKGARLLEVANMECFLSGDEILFTSLKAYENVDLQEFVKHLEGLKKKQISAFIVKRDQQTELQRIRFNILLQYAKSQQIPVIEIPKTLYYWGIIKHILTHIYDMETAKLTYFKTTHDSLEGRGGGTTYLVDEKDSVEKIFALIYSMLENPVALYDEEYECLHSNDPTLSEFTMKEDAEVFVPNIITKYQYWHQKREQSEYIHKIDEFGYRTFYLVVTEQNKKMETLDFIALENIVVVLRHIIMRSLMEKNIAKYYHKDIAYRLLNGTLTELEKEEAAKILKLEKTDEVCVVIFRVIPNNDEGKFADKQRKELEIAEKMFLHLLQKDYVIHNTNQIIYIYKKHIGETKQEFRKKLEVLQSEVQEQLDQKDAKIDFLVGIGKKVIGYHDIKESFVDAKRALDYINVVRKVVGDSKRSIVDCSKLGFFQVFAEIKDKKKLWSYIPESLQIVYEYDKKKKKELIDTLECFMNNNQSYKRTSTEMFVHYRTIMYRMKKIEEISGMDYENVTEMLAVRNGLIILRIMEAL